MQSRVRSVVWAAAWSLVGALMVSIVPAIAQTGTAQPAAEPMPEGAPALTRAVDLYMLVSIRKPVTPEQLQTTLLRGQSLAKCSWESLDLRPISSAAYRELESIIRAVEVADHDRQEDEPASVRLRQVPSRDAVWEFALTTPGALLKELKVKYQNSAGEPSEEKYEPAKFDDLKSPLESTRPGRYALRLPSGLQPVSYSMVIGNLKGDSLPGVTDQKWPSDEQFYLVVMRGFEGSRQTLFEKVRRKKNPEVANPIDVEFGRELQFSFGSIGGILPPPGPALTRTMFTAQVPWLGEERAARRVWVLFPLTKENQREHLEKFAKNKTSELPKAIRDSRPSLATEKEPLVLSPDSKPQWIELTPQSDGKYFSRDISISNFDDVAKAFPEVWWITSWEFDDGMNPPEAILAEDADKRPAAVISQPVPLWQSRVQALLSQPQPKTPATSPEPK